jgi:hypothetical protein
MKFKLNALVAAVAVLVSGAASAAMDTMASGNGTLALVAYDRTGTGTGSFMADLNFNIYDFLPTSAAAGQTIVWNFNANTISVNGVQQTGTTIAYSTEFASFIAGTQVTEMKWGVVGGDNINQRYVTTGAPTAANLGDTGTTSQSSASTASMANMDGLWLNNNVAGTHATAAVGAKFALSSEAAYSPVVSAGKIGTNGNWNSALKWNAVLGNNVASKFFLLDNTFQRPGTQTTPITTYGNPDVIAPAVALNSFSTFQFDQTAGTLTWTGLAAPIPEPGSYAMLLAGLAAVAYVGRRRRSA